MTATYRITVEPLGRVVECREDQPILDACLRSGVWLPHACTHGTCGTCKTQVTDGDVDHGESSNFALMDFERDEGAALVCTATPRSDLVLEADLEVEEGVVFHPVRDFAGTVVTLDDVARDVRRLVLDLDGDIAFNPGQYVQVQVPGAPAGTTRSYSIATPPSSTRRIELQIRRTPNGLATDGWIFSKLAVGDTVSLAGPFGRFFYRDRIEKPALLIAGGTGLSPIDSMIRHVLESDLDRRLILYQGARAKADLYDVERFRALEAEHPDRFTYRPCVSEGDWEEAAAGHAPDVLASDMKTFAGHVAYVCGPPVMVDAAMKTLMKGRLFPRDIYREDFFDSSDKAGGSIRSPLLRR
jgi:phenol/toluene 2-monooxygenase (NADH) P5/A5